ncbi:MAG: hypothetical protein RL404_768 [Pseudomonadota bacterium]|jgi:hypothetical protein
MDLYVYYRVRAEDADRLQPQVEAMQRSLSHSHHVAAALKRRPEEHEGRQTWMEIYLDVPEHFASALAGAAAALTLIDGDRHVETFVDLAPCA